MSYGKVIADRVFIDEKEDMILLLDKLDLLLKQKSVGEHADKAIVVMIVLEDTNPFVEEDR